MIRKMDKDLRIIGAHNLSIILRAVMEVDYALRFSVLRPYFCLDALLTETGKYKGFFTCGGTFNGDYVWMDELRESQGPLRGEMLRLQFLWVLQIRAERLGALEGRRVIYGQ